MDNPVLQTIIRRALDSLDSNQVDSAWQILALGLVEVGNHGVSSSDHACFEQALTLGWRALHGITAPENPKVEPERIQILEAMTNAYTAEGLEIDCLTVTYMGRFGNSIIQLANVVDTARALGISKVAIPSLWFLPEGTTEILGIRVANGLTGDSENRITLSGRFFYRHYLAPLISPRVGERTIAAIGERLTIPRLDPLPASQLVIHMRAGDVFRAARPHPGYGQPPLAFYQRVLEMNEWSGVSLVFEDQANPVIDPLADLCRANSLPITLVTGNLADDLSYLMRARTLVVGSGTFGSVIAGLATHLDTIFGFNAAPVPLGQRPVRSVVIQDVEGSFVRKVMSNNWTGSGEQRALMLEYPINFLSNPEWPS